MQTEDEIRKRLVNVRAYYDATWASRDLAAPTASELIWVLTGEEANGEAYLDREYDLPESTEGNEESTRGSAPRRFPNPNSRRSTDPLDGIGLNGGAPR